MIKLEGLVRTFNGARAVDDLSMQVPDGSIVALLGPNGAGKTTTVRMASGLIGITQGRASIDDVDVVKDPARARARSGLLMGDSNLYDSMTLEGYLSFFGEAYGLTPAKAKRRAAELAQEVGLSERLTKKIESFSKGMKQRVHLARALVNDPPALFLDEPTSGLDVEAAIEFRDRIKEFRHERRSIVLCTHVLAEAEELADDVVVIQRGKVVAHGSPSQLKRSSAGDRYRIRLAKSLKKFEAVFKGLPIEEVHFDNGTIEFRTKDAQTTNPEIVRRLVAAGADVIAVDEVDRTLQEAYVDIVRSARDAR
ncbi:MAG TPA: ABC transporter ATP-binding protein [Actinomycetota bacterium]|nr:ABC transporter ATP-binding protein [Actinomycetota bacterium]